MDPFIETSGAAPTNPTARPDGLAALVVNKSAGAEGSTPVNPDAIAASLRQHGFQLVTPDGEVHFTLATIDDALAKGVETIFVHGGDGSVNVVADKIVGTDRILGILPGGTMNLLARDLGIPDDPLEAISRFSTGQIRRIDVGRVNGDIFLCASMLGLPVRLARLREGGRGLPWLQLGLRMIRGAVAALSRHPRLTVTIDAQGQQRVIKTRAIAVSDNAFDLGGETRASRARLDGGQLVVYVSRHLNTWRLVRLAFSIYDGDMRGHPDLIILPTDRVTITTRKPRAKVMNDGESKLMETPLHYSIEPKALRVLTPGVRP